jgi:glycosyltransferase involved in cell wall biosynthesis
MPDSHLTNSLLQLQKAQKVLICNQYFPPDFAATGQLLEELAHHLGQQGCNIRVFTSQPGYAFDHPTAPRKEERGSLTIRRTRASRIWPHRIRGKVVSGLLYCLRATLHLLRPANRTDLIVLTTSPPYLLFIGFVAHLLLRIPYICLVYDLYPDVAIKLEVISEQHWLARLWQRFNLEIWKQSKGLIVLSSSMKEHIAVQVPELQNKIHVIHSWADPDKLKPLAKADNPFAQTHNLVNTFTVLYSGNMGRCHDMDTILETALLLKKHADIQFLFIGNGAQHSHCQKWVETHQLSTCRFLPYQPKETLPYSLAACDLALVSVKPGMEGMIAPSKLYGHLATAKPVAVICPEESYLRDMVDEGGFGRSFLNRGAEPLSQFIQSLKRDPQWASAMGRRGRAYLEQRFTPAIIAQQYMDLFQQCLNPAVKELDKTEPSQAEVKI